MTYLTFAKYISGQFIVLDCVGECPPYHPRTFDTMISPTSYIGGNCRYDFKSSYLHINTYTSQ